MKSIRFNESEQKRLNEIIVSTGLEFSTLVKKLLFDDNNYHFVSKNMIIGLCDISTNINRAKDAIRNNDIPSVEKYVNLIEKGVISLGQANNI